MHLMWSPYNHAPLSSFCTFCKKKTTKTQCSNMDITQKNMFLYFEELHHNTTTLLLKKWINIRKLIWRILSYKRRFCHPTVVLNSIEVCRVHLYSRIFSWNSKWYCLYNLQHLQTERSLWVVRISLKLNPHSDCGLLLKSVMFLFCVATVLWCDNKWCYSVFIFHGTHRR